MTRSFLLLCFFICITCLHAQEPRFFQHDLGNANVGITINTILQDRNCMLWLGTNSGLARYDGVTWHVVDLPTTNTVRVVSLAEDHTSRIWVGTEAGEIFYLDQARHIHPFDIEEGHPQKSITGIVEDTLGQVWFSTYGEGVYVYSHNRLFNFNMDDSLSGIEIYSMVSTPSGEIWLGTDDGISICSFQNETKKVRKLGLSDGLPDQIITKLKADEDGNVYIGTFESGLLIYDHTQQKFISVFENVGLDEITALEIFDGREIWMGTRTSGIWRFMPGWKSPRKMEIISSIKSINITDLLADKEGNIWITMNQGGLISGFRPFEFLNCNVGEIQTLFCDHTNQLWIGSKNGLYKLENGSIGPSTVVRVLPQQDLNITDILEDHFNRLWIGTLDKGLFIYDPITNKLTSMGSIIKKGGITIMSMAISKQKIWLATLEGVVSFPVDVDILKSKKDFQLMSDPWQSNLHFVFQVFVDSRDRVWFATDGNGVFCDDGHQVKQYEGNEEVICVPYIPFVKTIVATCGSIHLTWVSWNLMVLRIEA
jgi:ligand-binding sensor domain-containing protein